MKRIILTGGGTAGHVTPNIALIPRLKDLGYDIQYIGSYNGIEKELIEPFGVPYHGISSGKLRRYFSVQNFTDPFRVIKGFGEAKKLIKDLKPDVIFSKGGFVSVPVVLAGKRCKVPVIIHESDMTPGLANKIAIPSAEKVCCNFPETLDSLPKGKAVLTGSPIRQELMSGNKIAAMDFCGFTADKPVILVIGGSLGSVVVNNAVRASLPELLKAMKVQEEAELDCSFAVIDPIIHENSRVWRLTSPAGEEKLHVRETEDSEGILTVDALTEFLFGRIDTDELSDREGVVMTEHLSEELQKITKLTKIFLNEVV